MQYFPIQALNLETVMEYVQSLKTKLEDMQAKLSEYVPGKVAITEFIQEVVTDTPDLPAAFQQVVKDVTFSLPK